MATTFKTLLNNDIATTRTLLHEAIPITGSIASGTYADNNIKNYAHGMFQSVYDYPYLSSSANHIFDITVGFSSTSYFSSSNVTTQYSKKSNLYDQMAQVLVAYDISGNIRPFDQNGDLNEGSGDTKFHDAFFINFARLLAKDEIKKGDFTISFFTGGVPTSIPAATLLTLGDHGAANSFLVNSPTGEYGLLYTSSADAGSTDTAVGHIYYQAGIAVITSSIFSNARGAAGAVDWCGFGAPGGAYDTSNYKAVLSASTIQSFADGVRNRLNNIQFNNTTELNSTIYFCRANAGDFNYSANPTYLSASKIRVKGDNPFAQPVSYLTTIGLYSPQNELLAVAKVSEPLKKTPSNELTLRVRLDY